MELSPLSERAGSRTQPGQMIEKYDGAPVAGVSDR
jgi:hypothetical protein